MLLHEAKHTSKLQLGTSMDPALDDRSTLDGIADLLRYSSAGITEQILRPVWNAPAVFLVLLVLKLGEWLLRRRWRTI